MAPHTSGPTGPFLSWPSAEIRRGVHEPQASFPLRVSSLGAPFLLELPDPGRLTPCLYPEPLRAAGQPAFANARELPGIYM